MERLVFVLSFVVVFFFSLSYSCWTSSCKFAIKFWMFFSALSISHIGSAGSNCLPFPFLSCTSHFGFLKFYFSSPIVVDVQLVFGLVCTLWPISYCKDKVIVGLYLHLSSLKQSLMEWAVAFFFGLNYILFSIIYVLFNLWISFYLILKINSI